VSLVPSLLQAIVRVDGDALVMHPGDKPYVVAPTGQVELASRGLTLEAVDGIVLHLLPPELHQALEEFGAVQYELPAAPEFPGEHFTVVAARGGNDVWMEIRRRRVKDDDRVPDELFGPSASPAATPMAPPPLAAAPVMPQAVAAMPALPAAEPIQLKAAAINPPAVVSAPTTRKTKPAPAPVANADSDRDFVPAEMLGFDEPRAKVVQGDARADDDLLLPDARQLWPGRPGQPDEDGGDVEIDVDAELESDEEAPSPPVWQKSQPPNTPLTPPATAAGHASQPAAELPSQTRVGAESEAGRLRKEADDLLDTVRGQMDSLGVKTQAFEAFDERIRTLQSGVGDAESRMNALTARDTGLTALTEKVDGLSTRFATLFAQADDLTHKQVALETLHERLGQVDGLAKGMAGQLDALRRSRDDLDVLRTEIQTISKTHAAAVGLAEKLGADRRGLEAFGERMTAFAALAPELDAKIATITGTLQLVEEGTRKAVRLQESAADLDAVRAQVDSLGVKTQALEAFDERIRTLQSGVGDAESRMNALTARDTGLTALTEKVDGLSTRFATLFAQADDLTHRQVALETLHERMGQDGLAKQTIGQLDALRQSRDDLDVLRSEIQQFSKAHVDAVSEKLGAERLEAIGERMAAIARLVPGLEAKTEAITSALKLVEDGTRDAARLHESVAALDAQIARVTARVPDVETLEDRLNDLNGLSRDVDRKLDEQLGRRIELETFKDVYNRFEALTVDAQQKLDAVRALETALVPLTAEVTELRADISAAEMRMQGMKLNEAAIVELEKRYREPARPPQPDVVVAPESAAVLLPPAAEVDVPSQPVAVLSPPAAVVTLPPAVAVVVPISRKPSRSDQPPSSADDPTPSGLERLLRVSSARGASTLYLASESRPSVRVDGELQVLDGEPVTVARDVASLLLTLMPERSHEALRSGAATEWICDLEGVGRIRCMSFRDHRGPGGVFRLMPTRPVTADQLGLPRQVLSLAMEPEGLVLVAGSRSSGKRTLMSALVDLMNRTRRDHVITIEREINIVHDRGSAFVSQREVRGSDDDMLAAARAAMREDPDVLVIEELHTSALMNVALEAAAAGRLVIGGFPAHTVTGAIDRIIDLYAAEHRRQVQSALADSLRGVIVQVLLHKIGGGRLPAREVLLKTPAVSSAIAEGRTSQLPMAIEGGRRYGMMPLNDALVALVQSGVVEGHEAYRQSTDRPGLVAALNRRGIDTTFAERLA
jgi:twitching motility protein PilT